MQEKTKKIIFYGMLVILFLIISPILQIFPENKILIYSIYVIIIVLLTIWVTKKDSFYKKSFEERKRIMSSEDFFRKLKLIGNICAGIMFFLGIISYLLYKRVDMLITLCGFGLFFIIAVFLINKYGYKDD